MIPHNSFLHINFLPRLIALLPLNSHDISREGAECLSRFFYFSQHQMIKHFSCLISGYIVKGIMRLHLKDLELCSLKNVESESKFDLELEKNCLRVNQRIPTI